MDTSSAQHQYVTGQMRESFGPLFADHEARNARTVAEGGWQLDQPYGEHARECRDLRPAAAPRGTVLYLHAGYWQSRDKSQFRFLAPAFNALGWAMALANYPRCREVGRARIVESAALALRQLARHQGRQGRQGPLVLCGHSAGAHLAVELALRHAEGRLDGSPALAGVVAISGVFDLRPLLGTTLNDKLRLDAAQAQACSPCLRPQPNAVPALFLVGQAETAAFHAQSQDMARAWQSQGNDARCEVVAGTDHFSILAGIAQADGPVARRLQAWAAG
ncbi:MAG: alpha/beta hydrolase [Limnohabitans sp.]